jgi:hypothetical protein
MRRGVGVESTETVGCRELTLIGVLPQLTWENGGGAGVICNRGDVFGFFIYVLCSTLLHLPPVSENDGIEPRIVATSHWLSDALATRLHLIH